MDGGLPTSNSVPDSLDRAPFRGFGLAGLPLQGLRAAAGAPFRVQHDEGNDLACAATLAKFCDVAVVVAGYTWRDEGEYAAPGEKGPWTGHLLKKSLTPEDAPFARKMAELNKALGAAP